MYRPSCAVGRVAGKLFAGWALIKLTWNVRGPGSRIHDINEHGCVAQTLPHIS